MEIDLNSTTVEQMLSAHNIALLRCTSSADLQRALSQPVPAHASDPAPIALLTTLQKFAALAKKHGGAPADEGLGREHLPFDLTTLPTLLAGGSGGRRVAIIADEAHRYSVYLLYWYKITHTDAAATLRSHGAKNSLAINQLLGGRAGQSPHLTYIGFSATPSHAALRLFGVKRRGSNGAQFTCVTRMLTYADVFARCARATPRVRAT